VHPTGGSLRVFKQFAWLEVGSGKMALSRPAHQRVPRHTTPGQAASRWAAPNLIQEIRWNSLVVKHLHERVGSY